MATKSKNNKAIIFAGILILICAAIMTGVASDLYYEIYYEYQAARSAEQKTQEGEEGAAESTWPSYDGGAEENLRSFAQFMYAGSYVMYWQLQEKLQQRTVLPSEVFFSDKIREQAKTDEDLETQLADFDVEFQNWYDGFSSLIEQYQIEYRIVDQESGEAETNSLENLEQYESAAENAPFFLKMTFDEEGSVSIDEMQNQDGIVLSAGDIRRMTKARILNWVGNTELSPTLLQTPKRVTVYIYSENQDCYYTGVQWQPEEQAFETAYGDRGSGYRESYIIPLFMLALAAFLIPPFKRLRRESRLIGKIPFEAALAGAVLVITAYGGIISFAVKIVQSDDSWYAMYLLVCLCFHFVAYSVWFVAVMALLQVLDVGVVPYLKERSLLYQNGDRILAWLKSKIKKLVKELQTVDLTDSSDRWLLMIVLVNFVILAVLCSLWVGGILWIFLYSAVLFLILRRYLNRIKENYRVLLEEVKEMGEGNLNASADGDLGIFSAAGEELEKVKEGFSAAVEEELKSRNMKTELITNVSHDLKTPLTAIITYVNLLKEEGTTEEERKSYIEILDRKSLRLKKLIEDLFEISKAASGNIQTRRQQVDLAEMVKQAVLEQEDRLAEAKVDCRVSVPENRVLIFLDGEKTYRILENLIVNVSKYALAGTRAWITLRETVDDVEIEVKNTSAQELAEDCSYLTERFVRGDSSRNTEGSGLGLAIVKSFTELQGGSFRIETDGDLFKTIVRLKKETEGWQEKGTEAETGAIVCKGEGKQFG